MRIGVLLTLATATLFLGACTTYPVHDVHYGYAAYDPPPRYGYPAYPPVVSHVWIGGYREQPAPRWQARPPAPPHIEHHHDRRPAVRHDRDDRPRRSDDDSRRRERAVPRGPTFTER